MLVKTVLLSLLLLTAVPVVVQADGPTSAGDQWPVPCMDIEPEEKPPVHIYKCPEPQIGP